MDQNIFTKEDPLKLDFVAVDGPSATASFWSR